MAAPILILDLDGTLVDTVPDLAMSLNRLMRSRGLPEFSAAQTASMVGDGAAALVMRAFDARRSPMDDSAIDDFLGDYGANAAIDSALYPDVAATLDRLLADRWRLAVCTNKPEAPARKLLAALGIADRFSSVGGGDSFPTRKPHPAHLLATLAAAGGTVDAAVMAGDHANDVNAARAAGIPCVFCSWGYGIAEMARGAAIARQFSDLPEIAASLLKLSFSPRARSGSPARRFHS